MRKTFNTRSNRSANSKGESVDNEFVSSVDSLKAGNQPINDNNRRCNRKWINVKPPLYQGKELKALCRQGIPPSLRCAVWLTSIARHCDPLSTGDDPEEYATSKKSSSISYAYEYTLRQAIPNQSDEEYTEAPRFGLSKLYMKEISMSLCLDETGQRHAVDTWKRLLITLNHVTEVECCHLLPDIAWILLTHMPEGHAFCALREMLNATSDNSQFSSITSNTGDSGGNRYLARSKSDHYAWCKTFYDIMVKRHPHIGWKLKELGVLSPRGLDPIFKRFFVQIFQREYILRLMDIFVIEGYKLLFRFGITLIVMFEDYVAKLPNPKSIKVTNPLTYWNEVSTYINSSEFNFESLVQKIYGNTQKIKIFWSFPRRRTIERLMKGNENWAEIHSSVVTLTKSHKPMAYRESKSVDLITPPNFRLCIAEWVPENLRDAKLDLIYSTNEDGRSLDCLYGKCSRVGTTLMLIEVMETGGIIGMFATGSWKNRRDSFGDSSCFLFTLSPTTAKYGWIMETPQEEDDLNTSSESLNTDLIMIGKEDYIAMGLNKNGSCGLRLNEDLTEGESYATKAFLNDPLAGKDLLEFEIGIVEVYQFLRMDGKPVGYIDDSREWSYHE